MTEIEELNIQIRRVCRDVAAAEHSGDWERASILMNQKNTLAKERDALVQQRSAENVRSEFGNLPIYQFRK
jgi:hypothetical protein